MSRKFVLILLIYIYCITLNKAQKERNGLAVQCSKDDGCSVEEYFKMSPEELKNRIDQLNTQKNFFEYSLKHGLPYSPDISIMENLDRELAMAEGMSKIHTKVTAASDVSEAVTSLTP